VWTVDNVVDGPHALIVYVQDDRGGLDRFEIPHGTEPGVEVLTEDGSADPQLLLAGFWVRWMQAASATARATALATTPLKPYLHQDEAVYGKMLPQPQLRFLLADEPGTGKTIMAGLYLREMQRLGFVHRALIVVPAHLVTKWQQDFERFFGGGLRRITSATVKEGPLRPDQDTWIVSLGLAAVNPTVQEAIRPDQAGWDLVIIDEAHRLTPTAATFYRVGRLLCAGTPSALLMTATPHRGKEWLFRALLHLVDPEVFPAQEQAVEIEDRIRPGPVHFLRRIKEELVDYDGHTPLFKERHATNVDVPLNASERAFYNQALELVDRFFPDNAAHLARMVYGKRAASSLYALAETLKRRLERMGTMLAAEARAEADPQDEDPEEGDEAVVVTADSRDLRGEQAEIKEVLRELEPRVESADLAVSKWRPMLERCFAPNGISGGSNEQVVVFTEYTDTANWLVERFRKADFSVERYSGDDLHAQRDVIRDRFAARDFQILVSTDAGNEGIDLQTAHVLVNWDIPWSLVRLEQRMGRIHRVGQTRRVQLYNLAAVGTREGDAMMVLLDNLVTAANRLGGKLFDSLSLVFKIVGQEIGTDLEDLEGLLSGTYGNVPEEVVQAMKRMTVAQIEAAQQRVRNEEDLIKSRIDVEAATSRLNAEALERINPKIVEAFLDRLAATGLWAIQPMALGPGIYLLDRTDGAALPGDLGPGVTAKVATSGTAIKRARENGTTVRDVVTLGPAEAPFRSLVRCTAEQTRVPLIRGGVLHDPTSITPYDLYCFEADISEGAKRNTKTWTTLIRVDDIGARSVRWELLANLQPGTPTAVTPHPARRDDADNRATIAAADEQDRRAGLLEGWLADAQRELEHLPDDLTADIANIEARRTIRHRLKQTTERRIVALRDLATISITNVREVGWARVEPGAAELDPTEKNSEEIAMRHVAERLRSEGWRVSDVHQEGRGYDIHSTRGRNQLCVEVKGIWGSVSSTGVRLHGNEVLVGGQLGDEYLLWVVDQCEEGGETYGLYRNPIELFAGHMHDLGTVQIPGRALSEARNEEAAP
jgi:superfamily II DNA or RNA helicase